MKKLVCLVLVLLIFSPLVTCAQSNTVYMQIDFSESFNAKVFATGNSEVPDFSDPLNYISAYKQENGEWVPKTERALNKTAFEAAKDEKGLLYSGDGIPFDVNTNGGVVFGGRNNPLESVDINLKGIYADKLHMLFPATKGKDVTKKYIATVYYNDLSSEEITIDYNAISWQENTRGVALSNSYIKDASGTVDAPIRYYDAVVLDTDENKRIESVKLYTDDRYGGFAVIGITAQFNQNNYENYKSIYNVKYIKDEGKSAISFDEIFSDASMVTEDCSLNLSAYATGKYLFSPSTETKEDVDPYTSPIHGTENMLNLDVIKEKLEENKLTTLKAVYDFSHINGENRGVYVNNETAFFPETNYYSSINFIAYSHKNIDLTQFPVNIYYTDGSKEVNTLTLYQGIGEISEGKKNYALFNTGKVNADILWASLGETQTGMNEIADIITYEPVFGAKGMGYIFEYSVNVDSSKRIEKITLGNDEKQCYLFALTLNNAQITEETIQVETEKLDINSSDVYSKLFFIQSAINTYNITPPDKYYEVLNGVKEKFDGKINYTVSDLSEINEIIAVNKPLVENGANLCISIKEGNYKLSSPIIFNGTNTVKGKGRITLRGEKNVSFSGDTDIDGSLFEFAPESSNIYRAKINLPIEIKDETKYIGYVNLIKGDKIQPIASYPNKGYAHFDTTTEDFKGFYYKDKEFKANKDIIVEGYLSSDYSYQVTSGEIDSTNKIIKLNDSTVSIKYPNRRYRITNCLDELDAPGEWYLDRENCYLYYIPEKTEDFENLSLAYYDKELISIKDANNLSIENITFKNSRGNAVSVSKSDSITIKGCTFFNLSVWSVYVTDSTNTIFEENTVRDTSAGISMVCGDFDSLTYSGNQVKNNLMYNIGWYSAYGRNIPVTVTDTGAKIVGNTMYNLPFHAINYFGNDNIIAYNELYDLCKETNDVSAIYSNGKYYHRGSQVCYNYIHDINHSYNFAEYVPETDWQFNGVQCVYLDNALNGQYVHHNIFKDVLGGINVNCGQYNQVSDNTFMNTAFEAVNLTSYASGSADRIESFTADFLEKQNNEAFKKYEGFVNPTDTQFAGRPAHNQVTDNLVINGEIVFTQENLTYFGRVENNQLSGETNKHGLLISENINKQLLSESNYSLSSFGTSKDFGSPEIKTEIIQNNGFTFIIDDPLKTGYYEIYLDSEKIAEGEEIIKIEELPIYGDLTFTVKAVSKGIKVYPNNGKITDNFSAHNINNFAFLNEKGRDAQLTENEKITIVGNINNLDSKGSVFTCVYGDNGEMLTFKKLTGNDEIILPKEKVKEIKVFIWDMEKLFPYDHVQRKGGY